MKKFSVYKLFVLGVLLLFYILSMFQFVHLLITAHGYHFISVATIWLVYSIVSLVLFGYLIDKDERV